MRGVSRGAGFTLVEVVVAATVGVMLIVATGTLGLNVFHQRAAYDSISAATSLAERQFEVLRDIQNPVLDANFTNGDHTAANSPMKQDGSSGGPYNVTWNVADPFPSALQGNCTSAISGIKKITVRVTHTTNPAVNVRLVTYYKVC